MKKLLSILTVAAIIILCLRCNKDSSSANADKFNASATTGTGGSMARFTIAGNYLYTVDKADLKVFDINDPANPTLKKTVPVGFNIETIFPFKDKLFIGSASAVYIFSIANPEQPEQLSTAISPEILRRCDPVVAKDSVAYATLRTNGICGGTQSILATYDIRDITRPVQKNMAFVTEPYGLGYSDTALYVCDRRGLQLFNIKNAFAPQFIKSIGQEFYKDVIPYGNTLICWVEQGVILYDISNRMNPQLIEKIY